MQTAIPYQGSSATLELRIFAASQFITSDGKLVPASPLVYKSYTCTIAAGIVTIPVVTLDSTTDSTTNPNARYSLAALYETGSATPVAVVLDNFSVSHAYATTTWQTLTNQRNGGTTRRTDGVYSIFQTDSAIAAYGYSKAQIDARVLEDIADVNTASKATGDVLVWDGSEWVAGAGATAIWCLEFDDTKNHHVNTGVRWLPNTDYFSCFYEAWVWVQDSGNAAYVFSDGYGGAHNLLFGVSVSGGRVSLGGNFNNGTNANTYGSFRSFAVEEWHHIAVAYSETENRVICYIDGVPSGIITYVGSARNTLSNAGTGICFVGGSDHLNFKGRIKAVRGFEFPTGEIPVPFAWSPVVGPAINKVFRPEKVFRGSLLSDGRIVEPTLLLDFSSPTKGTIPDLGGKNHGKRSCNIGELTHDLGNFEGRGVFNDSESNYAEENLPQWVRADFEQPDYSGTAPGTIPAGAILYDDFRRQDVTFTWSTTYNITPGAARTGQTPALSVGDVGILNECLFDACGTLQTILWECSAANQDVTLTRPAVHAYSQAGETFGLLARYTDANNYLWAYCSGGNWNVVKRVAGTNTTIASGALGGLASYTSIRLVANGDNGYFYVNATQLGGTLNIASTGSGTKAGIYSYGSALTRYDSILVVAP